ACELEEARLLVGPDGCSAPNFAMPLASLARGFKNLATRGPAGTHLDAALGRVRGAMQAHPRLVSGEARFDHDLARAFGARVVSKGGAEALQAIGFSDPPLGIVVKVLDGGERALAPICLAGPAALGLLAGPPRSLAHRVRPAVTNHRGVETGAIVATVELRRMSG